MTTKYKLKAIRNSTRSDKKKMAIFIDIKSGKTKTTHFGAKGMSDFTIHKDPERKKLYINRHKKNENWNVPTSAGSLSRWILWNKPTYKESVIHYKKKFKL